MPQSRYLSRSLVVWSLLVLLLATAGCRQPNSYVVELTRGETVAIGDPVYSGTEEVAEVIGLFRRGDTAYARIRLSDQKFEGLVTTEAYRRTRTDRIDLHLSEQAGDARVILPGALIPNKGSTNRIKHVLNKETLIAVGTIVLALLVVFGIFKLVMKLFPLLIYLGLGAGAAYFAYPVAVPYLEPYLNDILERLDGTTASAAQDGRMTIASENVSTMVEQNPPDPVVVSYAALTLIFFVAISLAFSLLLAFTGFGRSKKKGQD